MSALDGSSSGRQPDSGRPAAPVRDIGIGILGHGFMGRAHSYAYRTIDHLPEPSPLRPRLLSIAGRSEQPLQSAAERLGFDRWTTDWRQLVTDPGVELFDNCSPNDMHAEASIVAAGNGKHVICEKPLARTAEESFSAWQAVEAAGVKHMCAFNYRFVPAVRLARQMIDDGDLGEIRHFRGRYLQDWGAAPSSAWRFQPGAAGSGALGDLAAHVIDLARFLVGEIEAVSALSRTFIPAREVDDAVVAVAEFQSGAVGTLEATRLAPGHRNGLVFEINGSRASIQFDLERLNELQVYRTDPPEDRVAGFRRVLVTDPGHPYSDLWWPAGHVLGWEHSFVHELRHFINAIAHDEPVAPYGATFEDGYRAAEVCDAIIRSAQSRSLEAVLQRAP